MWYVALLMLGLWGQFTYPAKKHSLKQDAWNAMTAQVDTWVDGLGMPIDPGIKDTVIVLNVLGFKTSASCEGHCDDWGLSAPWVDIEVEDAESKEIDQQRIAKIQEFSEKQSELAGKSPGKSIEEIERVSLEPLRKEISLLGNRIEKLAKTKIAPLRDLISKFYKQHKNRDFYDKILFLEGRFDFRLISIGYDWQIIRDEHERKKKLSEYQEEMQLFAQFLKKHYFAHSKT